MERIVLIGAAAPSLLAAWQAELALQDITLPPIP